MNLKINKPIVLGIKRSLSDCMAQKREVVDIMSKRPMKVQTCRSVAKITTGNEIPLSLDGIKQEIAKIDIDSYKIP